MQIKVYYLDDEPDLLEVFKEVFESAQVQISTFSDPNKAIAEIQARPPDILFLDYRLPNITGDEIALQLDPFMPKALISGDLDIVCQAKFVAQFSKPYKIPLIEEFISSYIKVLSAVGDN